jgi:hypothetical protein
VDNQFQSANPSIVKSIRQRELLNAWLRALRKPKPLPSLLDFKPDRINDDELADMMGFNVEGDGETARYVITHEGTRLTATYGNDHVDPAERTNRYLDDAIDPTRYAWVLSCYRTCLTRKRPTYSISLLEDVDGKQVSFERLLLPFGNADAVEQIVGSYKAISIEGSFKISNLMAVKPGTSPVNVLKAVIDLDFVRPAVARDVSDDIVEID